VFALSAVSLLADDPPPTFRSDVSLVRVDAHVVDQQNRSIPDLRVEDFVLREDGKQLEIRNFVAEKLPVDVILLLDVSRSMESQVQRVADAAHQALGALGDQDRIAIMVFDRATRLRLPFRDKRQDAERELKKVVDQETFEGGTDITRGLLDAAKYMSRNARRDARRAIVILTDDQTEFDRNDAVVLRALTRADAVLSSLIAPDALRTASAQRTPRDRELEKMFGDMMSRMPFGGGAAPGIFGPRTRSAGTSAIARRSGGDSVAVEEASAFEKTLSRIRERYALYFYLPEGVKPGDERAIEVDLSDAARQRHPGAEVRYRRSYLAPNGSHDSQDSEDTESTLVRLQRRQAGSFSS
jgi:VWFA-related protein